MIGEAEPSNRAHGSGSLGRDPVVARVRRTRDEELGQAGWLRRFTASPPRLIELRELYESLGHEVLLDPVLPGELATECEGCTLALTMFRVVYTRTARARDVPDDNDPVTPGAGGGQ
jgi:hypothetical protein